MKQFKFVEGLHFLLDVLEVITPISLAFQREDLFITDVISILDEGLMKLEGIRHTLTQYRANIEEEGRWTGPGRNEFHLIATGLGVQSDKFLDACLKYLSERFAFLEKTPALLSQMMKCSRPHSSGQTSELN